VQEKLAKGLPPIEANTAQDTPPEKPKPATEPKG
jgi:hypothetical protein